MGAITIDELDEDTFESVLKPIWNYLSIYDEPISADVLFVFGGLDLAVPRRAAELFLAGYARVILVTGNAGPKTPDSFGKPESIVFKDEMVRLGVDETRILTEVEATNTLQNVLLGMRVLQSRNIVIDKAILVARPFLSRRCMATFNRHYPSVEGIGCPPMGHIMEFCFRSRKQFAERLLAEVARLKDYSAKGDIKLSPIPNNVFLACGHLEKLITDS
jgi:hypothetical protein